MYSFRLPEPNMMKYVKINVTGYLKKTDYTHNYSKKSVQKAKEFY